MRRRTVVVALSLLILCLTPVRIAAQGINQATDAAMEPMWTSIIEFSNFFDISGGGLAQFDTSLYARGMIDKIVINAGIQHYVEGNWQTIKSWTSTSNSNSAYLDQKWYVVSGYYYRLVATGAVYEKGVLLEQASFTGPSYWYGKRHSGFN